MKVPGFLYLYSLGLSKQYVAIATKAALTATEADSSVCSGL